MAIDGRDEFCDSCRFYSVGTCRVNPPTVQPILTSYWETPAQVWQNGDGGQPGKFVQPPPSLRYNITLTTSWPNVGTGQWCGQYKRKPVTLPSDGNRKLDLEGKADDQEV